MKRVKAALKELWEEDTALMMFVVSMAGLSIILAALTLASW